MERKKAASAADTKTIKTAKTIAKSLPLVAARRDHSATLNYSQTTLKLLSAPSATTQKKTGCATHPVYSVYSRIS